MQRKKRSRKNVISCMVWYVAVSILNVRSTEIIFCRRQLQKQFAIRSNINLDHINLSIVAAIEFILKFQSNFLFLLLFDSTVR